MSKSFQIGELLVAVKQTSERIELKYESAAIHKAKVHVFFVSLPSIELLDEYWREVSNKVSMHFQRKLDTEFDRWNIYIIYIVKNGISKELRNKIENDKFSSRKIVEDSFSYNLTEKKLSELMTKHILNDDLNQLVTEKTLENVLDETYISKNDTIWKLIPENSIKRDTDEQKKIVNYINSMPNEN